MICQWCSNNQHASCRDSWCKCTCKNEPSSAPSSQELCGELFSIGFSLDSSCPLSTCKRNKGHVPANLHSILPDKPEAGSPRTEMSSEKCEMLLSSERYGELIGIESRLKEWRCSYNKSDEFETTKQMVALSLVGHLGERADQRTLAEIASADKYQEAALTAMHVILGQVLRPLVLPKVLASSPAPTLQGVEAAASKFFRENCGRFHRNNSLLLKQRQNKLDPQGSKGGERFTDFEIVDMLTEFLSRHLQVEARTEPRCPECKSEKLILAGSSSGQKKEPHRIFMICEGCGLDFRCKTANDFAQFFAAQKPAEPKKGDK